MHDSNTISKNVPPEDRTLQPQEPPEEDLNKRKLQAYAGVEKRTKHHSIFCKPVNSTRTTKEI